MVENHSRHLPVVDEAPEQLFVGLLDMAQCLDDAISKLGKINYSKGSNTSEEGLKSAVNQQGAQGAQGAALQALLTRPSHGASLWQQGAFHPKESARRQAKYGRYPGYKFARCRRLDCRAPEKFVVIAYA